MLLKQFDNRTDTAEAYDDCIRQFWCDYRLNAIEITRKAQEKLKALKPASDLNSDQMAFVTAVIKAVDQLIQCGVKSSKARIKGCRHILTNVLEVNYERLLSHLNVGLSDAYQFIEKQPNIPLKISKARCVKYSSISKTVNKILPRRQKFQMYEILNERMPLDVRPSKNQISIVKDKNATLQFTSASSTVNHINLTNVSSLD